MASQQIINDRYKVVTVLNHGSFGVVSLAKDTWNRNALVALKCINKSKDAAAAIDEAKEEIAVHDRLGTHPFIASILDHFETPDSTFLVMEYYPEGDLYEAIRADKGPRDSGAILEFMLQLIDAVEYAHKKGVYHRDIKPENILIASDGSVRLADWGLSTTIRDNSEFGVGSERYMAPELFDKSIDSYDAEKADIWSIGICLLNILFARNPFTIASQKDKLFLDFAANRESLFDIFPTLSCDVFSVLRYALTLDPDNRSLENMRQELYNVSVWTTDDEYYYDEYLEKLERAVSLESFVEEAEEPPTVPTPVPGAVPVATVTVPTPVPASLPVPVAAAVPSVPTGTPLLLSIVPTTVDREPLRTPTLLTAEPESFSSNAFSWNRTMQFTPPNPTFFRQDMRRKHGASRLSQVVSKDQDLSIESESEPENEVFAMDSLGSALPSSHIEQSPSATSDTSSISSVPSLVQSQNFSGAGHSISKARLHSEQPSVAEVAIPKNNIKNPTLSSSLLQQPQQQSNNQHQFQHSAGKSWSDVIFDDDEDFDENQLIQALSSMPKLPYSNSSFMTASPHKQPPSAKPLQSVAPAGSGADNWALSNWED